MKLKRIAPVFYIEKVPGNQKAGRCYGFLILINEKSKSDIGLHQHEYFHSMIFYIISLFSLSVGVFLEIDIQILPFSFLIYFLLNLVPDFRYYNEVYAYRHQMKFCKNSAICLEKFAERLTSLYKLPARFTYMRALRDLSR